MKYILSTLLILFQLGSLSAQTFVGSLNPFPSVREVNTAADDTVRILAIMVSFQEDADGTTFGNGKFESIYTQNYGNDILDPLPHDQQYFESHLQFVKNYFSKVSKGKLEIEYTVLPDTFSVSNRMRNYSPDPGSDDFTPVADFSVEAWTIADTLYPRFAFNSYDVFLIFHAGVGRDISLPGSIGNERDLPSVYLSENAFKEIYGNEFEGIPVMGGSFNITNSMIIPETESRELETISGTFLFEITINGLICASIGSHLGLPDLFDTETGLSAIGRFGLMDGQSIFAYSGTYPPEPSPWEKLFLSEKLGWNLPYTELTLQNADVSLVTNLAATMSDTVILKVPLNTSEYYLIENRIRDANNDGSTVTYFSGGVVQTKTFDKDTTGYWSFDVDSLSGVILDVDEFDWAVPGNGIVIWHIDENVINEKIADNAVNTDKNRRGVDVEEADGVQDIGERFFTIFGDEVIGEGTEEDFWHSDNPAELFQNRFAKDTRPNTLTNTGANSLITIKDFSEIDNRMSFSVEFGDSVVKPLFTNQIQSENIMDITIAGENENTLFFIRDEENIRVFDQDGAQIRFLPEYSKQKPAAYFDGQYHFLVGVSDSILTTTIFEDIGNPKTILSEVQLTSPPVINIKATGEKEIWVGTKDGRILVYNLPLPSENLDLINTIASGTSFAINQIAVYEDYWAAITKQDYSIGESDYIDADGNIINFDLSLGLWPNQIGLTKDKTGNFVSILYAIAEIFVVSEGEIIYQKASPVSSSHNGSIGIGDLKNDSENYIVFPNLLNLRAINTIGVSADNFPLVEETEFAGSILITDFEGDSKAEIITSTQDGKMFAIDGGSGRIVNGFPISASGGVIKTAAAFVNNAKPSLAIVDINGNFKAWNIGSVSNPEASEWIEYFGNSRNTAYVPAASTSKAINEFFPESRAYNYPNPVYEGTTNIRYYVAEDSKISIKIFDLAGDFVAELNDEAQGGMDNETVWNVGDIQSGVYFARIEANSTNGKTEQAVIKIAIVK